MKLEKILIDGHKGMGVKYDKEDFMLFRSMYKDWCNINSIIRQLNGRTLNVPDSLSEGLFCYLFDVYRTNAQQGSSSYDAYDVRTNHGIQIKACSIENDCTTFGPKTHWDEIYFMHFFPQSIDGLVEIYDISFFDFENLILNESKHETFKDQQLQGRRPRFGVKKEIIDKYSLKPIKTVKLLEEDINE